MNKSIQERDATTLPGMLMVLLLLVLTAAAAWWVIVSLLNLMNPVGAIIVLAFLLFLWGGFFIVQPNQTAVLQFFGKYSYAIYVFQLPLIYLMAPLFTAQDAASILGHPVAGQALYCASMFALTTLAALASWHLFEKRLLTLKHRFGG